MSIQIVRDTCEKKLKDLGLYENKSYHERFNKEINIIQAQGMSGYLLDCAEKAKAKGKVKNTNNMLVTYLLEITDEDPVKAKAELIKTKHEEFPDIDSDFEDSKRNLVKQYLINKYGENNVASIISFGKSKVKGTIKDVSRIKGIPYEEVNEVNSYIEGGQHPDTLDTAYEKEPVKAFFDKYSHLRLYEICKEIEGNVRQPSRHAAGILVSPVPIYDAAGMMKVGDEITTCWEEGVEVKELSKVGLIKIDLLGLNTITVFSETVKMIKRNLGIDINLSNLDLNDVKVLKQFYDGNTVGIFQFEQEKLRSLMRKIKVGSFNDISVINALNRPGPLKTKMDEKLCRIKAGQEKISYLHPKLEPILSETYGIIIYQEQLIKIVQELAGMSADEADNFRRVMTKDAQAQRAKGTNPLEKFEKQFVQGCLNNGIIGRVNVQRTIYDDAQISTTAKDIKIVSEGVDEKMNSYKVITCNVEISDEIWHQMKSFAEYGFNKCLTGDVKIKLAPFGIIKVSTLFQNKSSMLPGLKVTSFNTEGTEFVDNNIVDIVESGVQEVYLLTTKTKRHVTCTINHKIRTQEGWKELGQISMNDKILVIKNAELYWDEVKSIKRHGKKMTYDVSLADQSHPYFFANNLGVHNSHSTAYAYLAYQGMYLKTYYPKEYMASMLTLTPNSEDKSDGSNFFISYFDEAIRMGIKMNPPSVNKSFKEFTVDGEAILSGLGFVKGIGENAIKEVVAKRPYKNIKDFLMKTNGRMVNKTVFHALVHCGAFDEFLNGKDATYRYEFINEFNKVRKIKGLEARSTLLEEIEKESEVCGGEIFNGFMRAFDIKTINQKYEADEKILDFRMLDKIDVNSEIRVFGKIERLFIRNVGFVDVVNGRSKKTFMLWKDDVDKLEKSPLIKNLFDTKSIITFKVKRTKDYNGKKSFNMIYNSIEPMQNDTKNLL